MLPKLFWPTVRTKCSSDWEKILKFEAEGREFAKFLRSLEQFIQTLKGQNNFLSSNWKKKTLWFRNTQGKFKNVLCLNFYKYSTLFLCIVDIFWQAQNKLCSIDFKVCFRSAILIFSPNLPIYDQMDFFPKYCPAYYNFWTTDTVVIKQERNKMRI